MCRRVRPWAELLGVGERPFERLAVGRLAQTVEIELVTLRDRVGPVGDDPEPVEVAGDQQGRVLEGERIALQLIERPVEALAPALVFPAEAAALPDVRPAFAAGGLGGAALEAVPLALGVGVGRLGLVQQLAQVVEVRLRRRPLLEVGRLPFGDELLRRHRSAPLASGLEAPPC